MQALADATKKADKKFKLPQIILICIFSAFILFGIICQISKSTSQDIYAITLIFNQTTVQVEENYNSPDLIEGVTATIKVETDYKIGDYVILKYSNNTLLKSTNIVKIFDIIKNENSTEYKVGYQSTSNIISIDQDVVFGKVISNSPYYANLIEFLNSNWNFWAFVALPSLLIIFTILYANYKLALTQKQQSPPQEDPKNNNNQENKTEKTTDKTNLTQNSTNKEENRKLENNNETNKI